MRRGFAGFVLAGFIACGPAKAQNTSKSRAAQQAIARHATEPPKILRWAIDPAHSSLTFKAEQNGEAFEGRFKNFTANIVFDPHNLSGAHVDAHVDLASVDAGSSERNQALPDKDWFYVKKYPQADFVSDTFTKTGPDAYEARGILTIKGISQPLVLPFDLKITDGRAIMDGHLTLDRSQYHIGTGVWDSEDWVSHKVEVFVHIEATKK